ncbi:MAG: sugar ABC transporter substrate-binding protein [Spirochaetia bacterium]|nr:sugar ABC transporter substrate-binding protein [Spirochaetia bacterium]
MRKKLLATVLIISMIGCLFAAGQAESATAKAAGKKTDLLLWLPPFGSADSLDQAFWAGTLQPWAEKNNVNLEIEITPWGGYEEKYLTGFASGEGPDVGYMYLEMFNDFIEMETLAEIDSYFTDKEKQNYIYWDQGKVKGKQYVLPFIVGNPRIPFMNMDILAKAGVMEVPVTWDELITATVKIKNKVPGVIPFAQEWADPAIGALNNVYYPYLWQSGGEIYNSDSTAVALLDNGAGVEAAQFLYDLKFKHGVISDECMAMAGTQVRDAFIEGRVAIASMDARSAGVIEKAGLKNWTFIPSFQNKTKAIWVASDSLIMNSACENKELAASLMKQITSASAMASFHKEISSFPPITYDEPYNDNPIFKDMFDNDSKYFHTLPVAEGAFMVMDTLYKNLQLMMLGDLSPEKAIENTVKYSKSVISK